MDFSTILINNTSKILTETQPTPIELSINACKSINWYVVVFIFIGIVMYWAEYFISPIIKKHIKGNHAGRLLFAYKFITTGFFIIAQSSIIWLYH